MPDTPQKIRVIFSTGTSAVSKVIRFFTWGEFSHVDYVDQSDVIGADERAGGVIRLPLDERKRRSSKWVVLEFEGDNDKMKLTMESLIGKPYDYGAIAGFLLRRKFESSNKWFCSEAIYWAAKRSGVLLLRDKRWRISPKDLMTSPLLKEVARG